MCKAAESGSLEFVISATALQSSKYVQQDTENFLAQTTSVKSKSPESVSCKILHSDSGAHITRHPHHEKCHCPRTVKPIPTLVIII